MPIQVPRRRFLEDSLLALTAVAAVGASPGLLAANDKRVASNEKVGLAIVGAGSRGGEHITAFKADPRVTILYLCDPDPSRGGREKLLDEIAKSQEGIRPKYVSDFRKALEDKSLDAISCASTNHWHALTGIWAMQAGKHCYIEKPISHNIHEGRALEAAAKKYGLVVQTGTQCRSNPSNIDAVKFVQGGGIGEVRFARGLCFRNRPAIGPLGDYPIPKEVDYDLWSGPAKIEKLTRPRFHYDWHWQRLYGNGDMGNQGPHQTDIARWHLGLDRYPNAIVTYGGRLGYDVEKNDPNYIDAGDTANIEVTIFDYGNKCIVFETRGLKTPSINGPAGKGGASVGVIVYGNKGYLIQSTYTSSSAYDTEGNLIREFKGENSHCGNFIDAVLKNDPSIATAGARCGALSAGLSHLGNISYYLGEQNKVSPDEIKKALKGIKSLDDNDATVDRTVQHLADNGVDLKKTPLSMGPILKFDPGTQCFVDNKEADAMLSRDYREPYVVPTPEKV